MINAGIAGLGRWGKRLVGSVQNTSDKIRFVAGCTGHREAAETYCREAGIELYDGFEKLLERPDLDAVVLATPHSLHAGQIKAAARAGKHIFVEKPLALTVEDAERAIGAARQADVVLALGHNRRFLPAMQRMRELAQTGGLGQILHMEGNISAAVGAAYSSEHWRTQSTESPAGGMTGLGIHIIDAMISILGPVKGVIARSFRQTVAVEMDDTTIMLLKFANGATGYLGTLTATPFVWRLQVFGTEGSAEMRGYDRLIVKRVDGEEEVLDFAPTDMERAELEAFAEAIMGGGAYPLPLDEARAGVAALEAIVTAARDEVPVTLNDG